MDVTRRARSLRAIIVAALSVAALAVTASPAAANGTQSSFGITGKPITSGPNYDRNASVVQDGKATYVFFARSRIEPCNRLAGCDPDQRKYDLFYKKSLDGGRSYGPAQQAAANPDPTPDANPNFPYGGFRGRTIAATKTGNKITVFWSDGGFERELYKVEKVSGSDTFTAATMVPFDQSVFNIEAITRGNQTFLYAEGTGSQGYGVYAHAYTAGAAGPGTLVSADRNLPKAIVDKRNGLIRLTYVDASNYPQVDVYVNSSANGITFGPETLAVAAAPGESNWDPNLLQVDGAYLLFFAPDRGAGKQQIALATSRDFNTWTRRGDITPGEKDGVKYWDYWPEGFANGKTLSLFYASERGFTGNPTGIGHIWAITGGHDGRGHGHFDDDDEDGHGHGHGHGGRWDD
jgi:hypothetical protein